MQWKYHGRCWSAIAGGTVAAAGATALLIRDGWTTGWTVDLALMPALVGLTILSGHLFWKALSSGRIIAAGLIAILAAYGSLLTINETMGRRAELRDGKVMSAEAKQTARAAAAAELASVTQTYNWALPDMASECTGAPDPLPPHGWPKCRSKRGTVKALEQRIATLKADVAAIAPAPVDAKMARAVTIASWFGASPALVREAYSTLEPFLMPIFLELASIVLFSYGLGRGSPNAPAPVGPRIVANDDEASGLDGEKYTTKSDALADLRRMLGSGQRVPSQDYLRERWHVRSKGTVSKWLSEWESEGKIPSRQRDGKVKFLEAA